MAEPVTALLDSRADLAAEPAFRHLQQTLAEAALNRKDGAAALHWLSRVLQQTGALDALTERVATLGLALVKAGLAEPVAVLLDSRSDLAAEPAFRPLQLALTEAGLGRGDSAAALHWLSRLLRQPGALHELTERSATAALRLVDAGLAEPVAALLDSRADLAAEPAFRPLQLALAEAGLGRGDSAAALHWLGNALHNVSSQLSGLPTGSPAPDPDSRVIEIIRRISSDNADLCRLTVDLLAKTALPARWFINALLWGLRDHPKLTSERWTQVEEWLADVVTLAAMGGMPELDIAQSVDLVDRINDWTWDPGPSATLSRVIQQPLAMAAGNEIPPTPIIVADQKRVGALRQKYQKLAGKRKIVGISWYAPNKRSGQRRSIPDDLLRSFVERLSDRFWFVGLAAHAQSR